MISRKSNLFHVVYANLVFVGVMMLSHTYGIQQPKENLLSEKIPYANLLGTPRDPVEKDFNQIKKYYSYDPITNHWSAIEDFKTITRLDGVSLQAVTPYIYYHFWAYDAKQKQWKRVNIGNYQGGELATSVPNVVEALTETDEKPAEKSKNNRSFWSKVGFTASVGGGALYSRYQANQLDLFVKKGGPSFYFQIASTSDSTGGKGHQIVWPEKRYIRSINYTPPGKTPSTVANDKNSYSHATNQGNLYFQSVGMSIPVDLGLHYTFFNKLRMGFGGNLEANYVKTLTPGGDAKGQHAYSPAFHWSYHVKPYGSLAYKCFQKEKSEIVIDVKIGTAFDLGTSPWENLTQWVRGPGLYANIGVANERKLNDYLKWFYRVGIDLKKYKDDADFQLYKGKTDAFVNVYHASLNLTIGTYLSFDRDVEEQDEAAAEAEGDVLEKIEQAAGAAEAAEEKLQQAEEAKQKAKRAMSLFKR